MRKQPKVTERTRQALSKAFWDLYAGCPETDNHPATPGLPIEKISVRQITDRAGYNRATFYLYYRDVYDLLSQIEESILSDAREVVDKRLLQGDELNFSQHMGYIAELAKNSRPYLAALLGPHGDPAFASRLKQALRPLVARFLTNDPALNPKEKDLLDEFYLAGMLAAITRWLDECDDMPIEALIQLISKHVL